jgi:hypothetical protein
MQRLLTVLFLLTLFILLTISAGIVLTTSGALADPANLAGTSYGFTGSATCINSQEGFNQNFTPVIPDAWLESFSVEGIRAFSSGGTGKVTGVSTGVEFGTGKTSASSSTFTYNFTYTVLGDTWTSSASGPLTGLVTAGPRKGETFSLTGLPDFSGFISKNASSLTAAENFPKAPAVETIVYSDGTFTTVHRICNRSRVFIDLPGQRKSD